MAEQTRDILKSYFNPPNVPTRQNYVDLIDSFGLVAEGPGVVNAGSTFPAFPKLNEVFFRTDLNALVYWNGVNWYVGPTMTMVPAGVPLGITTGIPVLGIPSLNADSVKNLTATGITAGTPVLGTPTLSEGGEIPVDNWLNAAWWYIVCANYTASTINAPKFSIFIGDKKSDRQTFRNAMVANGFEGIKLHYIVICQIQDSGGTYWPMSNQWAYKTAADRGDGKSDWDEINGHEDWFLHSGTPATLGNRISSSSHWWYMDHGSVGWQNWVKARAQEMANITNPGPFFGYPDGIFLDNVELAWTKPYNASGGHLYDGTGTLIANTAAYVTRVTSFLVALSSQITADKLWGNMISGSNSGSQWNPLMAYLKGGMHEASVGWDTSYISATQMEGVRTQLSWCQANNKGWIFTGQGDWDDEQKETFAVAGYMLIVPANSTPTSSPPHAFRYTRTNEYIYWREYANLLSSLGNPLGDRFARSDGPTGYKRLFQRGYVQTDDVNHIGQIVYEPPSGIDNLIGSNIVTGTPVLGTPTVTDVAAGADNLSANGITSGTPVLSSPKIGPLVATAVSTAPTQSMSVNVPAGTENGMIMILHASARGNLQAFNTPDGWTLVGYFLATAHTPDTCSYIFKRVANNEPASYTVTDSLADSMALSITVIPDYDDVHLYAENHSSVAVTSFDTIGITTTIDNCFVLNIVTIHGNSNNVPTSDTAKFVDIIAHENTSNDVSAFSGFFVQASAGATGNKNITIGTARYTIGWMVALTPMS